jgi:hypothetical protein
MIDESKTMLRQSEGEGGGTFCRREGKIERLKVKKCANRQFQSFGGSLNF